MSHFTSFFSDYQDADEKAFEKLNSQTQSYVAHISATDKPRVSNGFFYILFVSAQSGFVLFTCGFIPCAVILAQYSTCEIKWTKHAHNTYAAGWNECVRKVPWFVVGTYERHNKRRYCYHPKHLHSFFNALFCITN